jgi:hypothetical protein
MGFTLSPQPLQCDSVNPLSLGAPLLPAGCGPDQGVHFGPILGCPANLDREAMFAQAARFKVEKDDQTANSVGGDPAFRPDLARLTPMTPLKRRRPPGAPAQAVNT